MGRGTTILLILVLTGLLASSAKAQLFRDDFIWPAGDTLTQHGYSTMGTGDYSNPIIVVSPGLRHTGFAGTGIGNAVRLNNSGQDLYGSFPSVSARSLYVSFLVNFSQAQKGDCFFVLTPASAPSNYALRIFAKYNNGSYALGVSKSGGNPVYGWQVIDAGSTYLVVVKYTFVAGDSNDVCSMYSIPEWVPIPVTEASATPDVDAYRDTTKEDQSDLGLFMLRQGYALWAPTLTIDGIRIDTTWAGALGIGSASQFNVAPSPLDLGQAWLDSTKTDTLTVTNSSKSLALQIDSVKSTNVDFTVSPASVTIDTMQTAKFVVSYLPSLVGADTGLVRFYHNAPTHQDSVRLTGIGAVKKARLDLQSHALLFGRSLVGQTRTDSVKIKNAGELTLAIGSVTDKNPATFQVALVSNSVPAGDSTYVKVTFKPLTSGAMTDTIIFTSNAPEGVDTLVVSGTGAEPAALFSLFPRTLSFGNLRASQWRTDTLQVKNPGELTLKIASITRKNPMFFVYMADSVLAGDSTKLFVRFAPTSAGTFKDTVVFTSNASEVTDTLYLSGTASDVIAIATARAMPVGSEVIVRGVVTRVRGSYTFFQDTTGGMIMYSNVAGDPAFDSVATGAIKKGDLLEVDGHTSEYASLILIGNSDILNFRRISRGNTLPAPKTVTLAELVNNGENYEAQLVTLRKLSFVTSVGTFSNKASYKVADSSDASGSTVLHVQGPTDTQLGGMTAPGGTFTFLGVLGQFTYTDPATGYELLPVDSADVKPDLVARIADLPSGVPTNFELVPNFPNPFNPTTTIQYSLPTESRISVTIYSMLGQEVRTLVGETQKASYYRVVWDGLNEFGVQVATGLYFCRFTAEPVGSTSAPFIQVRKMLMLK